MTVQNRMLVIVLTGSAFCSLPEAAVAARATGRASAQVIEPLAVSVQAAPPPPGAGRASCRNGQLCPVLALPTYVIAGEPHRSRQVLDARAPAKPAIITFE